MATNIPILPSISSLSARSPPNIAPKTTNLLPSLNSNIPNNQSINTVNNGANSNMPNNSSNANSKELNWVYVTKPHVKKKYRPRKKPISQLQPLLQVPSAPLTGNTMHNSTAEQSLLNVSTGELNLSDNNLVTNLLTNQRNSNIHLTNINLTTINNIHVVNNTSAPNTSSDVDLSESNPNTDDMMIDDIPDFASPKMKISFLLN